MGYPAETVDGKIVRIVEKIDGDDGSMILVDEDGTQYKRSSNALKIEPVVTDESVEVDVPARPTEAEFDKLPVLDFDPELAQAELLAELSDEAPVVEEASDGEEAEAAE